MYNSSQNKIPRIKANRKIKGENYKHFETLLRTNKWQDITCSHVRILKI